MRDVSGGRWMQRLESFGKALANMRQASATIEEALAASFGGDMLLLLKEGLLQRFEITQELAWKVMKDYLEYQGENGIMGSRDAFRRGLRLGLIDDERWLNSITDRNITSHAYDEQEAGIIYDNAIRIYLPLFERFLDTMKRLAEDERMWRGFMRNKRV